MPVAPSNGLPAIRAILFDKDGTLFDFEKTWGPFGVRVVEQLAAGEPELTRALAGAIGVDLAKATYAKDSPVIAGSPVDVVAALLPHLPRWRPEQLVEWLDREAQSVGTDGLHPASADLGALLSRLAEGGFALGVATNDSLAAAEQNLADADVRQHFDAVFGYDSVANAKPASDMILAFAAALHIPPSAIAMIGDSLHDLHAARAAGCGVAIGVLTGLATEATLAPVADAVLPSIDALPEWFSSAPSHP
ncbi:MAG: HAD family hydrolase [Neomegalonema sp.]|nr:HAD family hydrolase [Neomegalonema sp.]